MKFLKRARCLFAGIGFCILFDKFIIPAVLDTFISPKPLKFESYRTEEEFNDAVKNKFKVNQDLHDSINIITKSGANCSMRHDLINSDTRIIRAYCNYWTRLISLHPLEEYEIWLYSDLNNKIIKVSSRRTTGIELITW